MPENTPCKFESATEDARSNLGYASYLIVTKEDKSHLAYDRQLILASGDL